MVLAFSFLLLGSGCYVEEEWRGAGVELRDEGHSQLRDASLVLFQVQPVGFMCELRRTGG